LKSVKHLTIVAGKLALVLIVSCFCTFSLAQKDKNISFEQKDKNAKPPVLPMVHIHSVPGWLHLRNIVITGNKKTKDYIIKREMNIKPGDSIAIPYLSKRLEEMRQYIYNTTLFVTVKVEPILLNAFECDIIVSVKERFYILPIPIFQLADRSFDEWLGKYNGNLNRVNYGVNFAHYNLTGRKDQLRLYLINGYTRNISASYNAPYSNAKLTEGFYVDAGFSQSKEIPYKTNYDNSLAYFKTGGFVRDYWYLDAGYTIRKAIKTTQIISAGYSHIQVSDSVISNNYNTEYFNSNSPIQSFVDLAYTIQYSDVDNILYPLEGVSGHASLQKRGFGFTGGLNMISLEAEYDKFNALGKQWFTSFQFSGKVKLPFKQPFVNQRALGDNNMFLRGLDYYTIDGVAFGTAKFNLKKEIFSFNIPTFIKSKPYNNIPIKIYAKAFTDFGYVYSIENLSRLNNKLLSTAGFGLDILTLYDFHIRLDYSLNQLGQKRLAVNNRSGF
jgi:outer membrane protein assembly factor BamA